MIDLHCHILPCVDDGANDMAVALQMAEQAVAQQISIIAATPHFHDLTWQIIRQKVEQLNQAINDHEIDLQVIPGAELFVDPDISNMEIDDIPTYNNNGRYCLIEYPMWQTPHYDQQVLFSLKVKGITPIIAHPERYKSVIDNPNIISKWVDNQCLIQINAGSVVGMFGETIKETAEILLEHKMVHLIASDAHSAGRRGFMLSRSYDRACELIGRHAATELVDKNPSLVIEGGAIRVPDVIEYQRRKRFWFFNR